MVNNGDEEGSSSSWAPKSKPRRVKLRPVFPRVDWMIVPNTLAYAMSWYGLFVGKFPCQVLSAVFGLAVIFTSGMHRIQIADLRPEDYLPTDSRSTIERALTTMFDYNDPKDPAEAPNVIMPVKPKPPRLTSTTRRSTTIKITETTEAALIDKGAEVVPATLITPEINLTTTSTTTTLITSRGSKKLAPISTFSKEAATSTTTTTSPSNSTKSSGFFTVKDFPFPFHERKKRESYLDPQGRYQSCRINSVLIVAKKNSSDKTGRTYNLFDRAMLREIERLENEIFSAGVEVYSPKSGDGGTYYYEDKDGLDNSVCTKQQTGECGGFNLKVMRSLFPNDAVKDPLALVFSTLPGIGLTYPHYMSYDLSQFFGKVETVGDKHNGVVKHIGAIREVYCVNEYQADWFKRAFQVWLAWEKKFHKTMGEFRSKYFDVYWIAEYQKQAEQDYLIKDMLPKVGVTFIALMLWCTVGALMNDAVRSKPWAGIIGVFATLIGCVSGFGICLWITPKFWPIIMAVPLLTLAIGLDDMFILLEAWSHTNPALPVEERIMLSMNVGGTSIVITFFINMLDFVIGNYTPYPLIQALSTYAIATMVLDFFFQMTIFCAGLSLFGASEENNRHACCCCIALPTRAEVLEKVGASASGYSLLCCAGGLPRNDPEKMRRLADDEDDNEAGHFQAAISNFISRTLTRLPFRICAIIGFFFYLAMSIWSITQMELGLKAERIYRRSSNLYDYAYHHRHMFTAYSNEIMVVVHNPVEYWRPDIQRKFVDFIDKVKGTGYFWGQEETKCWIVDFVAWANANKIDLTAIRSNRDLINVMRRYPDGFLASSDPTTFSSYGLHSKDIRITPDGSTIKKSRFRLRAKNMTGPGRQIGMMTSIRDLVDRYRPEIQMFTYTSDFQMYDQYLTAVPATMYYCGMTLGCTIVVAIFMIPHPACLFWVAVFVSSVLVGIIGQMRIWDMDLDSVSLINLLIAISFCSDLIAHPVYIFLITPVPKTKNGQTIYGPEARLMKARALIEEVAAAAVPACVGTTLSVIAMSTSDAYIFIAFFRIMFLSVVLSVFHALVFVPAFLSFIGPSNSGLQNTTSGHHKEEESTAIPSSEKDANEYYEVVPDETSAASGTLSNNNSEANLIQANLNNDGPIVFKVGAERLRQPRPVTVIEPKPEPPPAARKRSRRSSALNEADRELIIGFLPQKSSASCRGGGGLRMFYGPKRIWDKPSNAVNSQSRSNNKEQTSGKRRDEDDSSGDEYYLPATIRPVPIVVSSRRAPLPPASRPSRHNERRSSDNMKASSSSRQQRVTREQPNERHQHQSRQRSSSSGKPSLGHPHSYPDIKPLSRVLHHRRQSGDTESSTFSNDSLGGSHANSLNKSRTGVEMLPAKHRFNY